jgi:hypothetical protein
VNEELWDVSNAAVSSSFIYVLYGQFD